MGVSVWAQPTTTTKLVIFVRYAHTAIKFFQLQKDSATSNSVTAQHIGNALTKLIKEYVAQRSGSAFTAIIQ
jgi:hypothetical protein